MRKWKCVSVNEENRDNFTVGKIYETDGRMLNCKTDNGYVLTNVKIIEKGDTEMGLVFEEIKEEEKKVNKFKVGDIVVIVVGNSTNRYGYTSEGVKCKVSKVVNNEFIKVNVIDGNYTDDTVEFEVKSKYFDFYLVKPSPFKTITITTSDSTTTLTDGIITVSVNRYHTDKHDEEIAVREVADKYYQELDRIEREKNRKPTKGKDLIGVEITKETKFKIINVEPHRDKGYVCLDEYIGKIGTFAKDNFKFTEDGYMYSATFKEDYMNAIDKKNGRLCWRYDEVEILWED